MDNQDHIRDHLVDHRDIDHPLHTGVTYIYPDPHERPMTLRTTLPVPWMVWVCPMHSHASVSSWIARPPQACWQRRGRRRTVTARVGSLVGGLGGGFEH